MKREIEKNIAQSKRWVAPAAGSDFIDISVPLDFYGEQPNAFGVDLASSRAVEAGELVGDTRRGGSCNFERITFIPHCNGTHTECVGHITNDRLSITDCLKDAFVPAVLASVVPETARTSRETYAGEFGKGDLIITKAALAEAISKSGGQFPAPAVGDSASALIVRTLPNDRFKLTLRYDGDNIPPYFSSEAVEFITSLGVKHLLVDLPSIDRLFDDGRLSNHRIFWNVRQGEFAIHDLTRVTATITELIYVPNEVQDGEYLLNLQIAPFVSDASPSRPLLFPISGH